MKNLTPPEDAAKARALNIRVVAALLVVSLAFGGNFLWIRVVVHSMPPLAMQAVRFVVAGAVLFAFRAASRGVAWPSLRQWLWAAVGGVLLVGIAQGLVAAAEQFVDAGVTVLTISTIPLWTAILARTVLHERLGRWVVIGVLLGFAGLFPIVLSHGTAVSDPVALIWLLFAALAWAIGSLVNARIKIHPDPFMSTAMQMLVGGALLVLAALPGGEWPAAMRAFSEPQVLSGLAYLVIVGSIIGYSAYIWLLNHASPSVGASFAYLQSVVGVVLGALILHEELNAAIVGGALLIVAGVAFVVLHPRAPG